MASANEVIALIKAHFSGDDEAFGNEVARIVASAAQAKNFSVAASLRSAYEQAMKKRKQPTMLMLPLAEQSTQFVNVCAPKRSLDELVLSDDVKSRIDRVLEEQRAADRLREYGFDPARKLLLWGPPGTGKTVTAEALAKSLGLPLCIVQTHAVIESYLGNTAKNMRTVFDMMGQKRGVYFFDEFDSIANSRDSADNEVGEMKRVVNMLLVSIESDTSSSVIVAATNLKDRIDSAFTRRFDVILSYSTASAAMAEAIMRAQFERFDTSELTLEMLRVMAANMGHADVEAACKSVAKDAVLSGNMKISDRAVRAAILLRRRSAGLSEPVWQPDEHERFGEKLRAFAEEDRANKVQSPASLNLSRVCATEGQRR